MIYENIDNLIASAMKNHDNVRLSTLRLIKTKFLEYKTSKGAKPIDENIEITILRKMVNERMETVDIYRNAGRNELADKEEAEMNIIKEFIPEAPSEDKILEVFNNIANEGLTKERKNMGLFIKKIKEVLPLADGKTVSTVVMKNLS